VDSLFGKWEPLSAAAIQRPVVIRGEPGTKLVCNDSFVVYTIERVPDDSLEGSLGGCSLEFGLDIAEFLR
jgi:hypothetical protein